MNFHSNESSDVEVQHEWRDDVEVSELEGISTNSDWIAFLEIGEISIEENERSEEVSRKHEGNLRHDEISYETSLVRTKMKLGI